MNIMSPGRIELDLALVDSRIHDRWSTSEGQKQRLERAQAAAAVYLRRVSDCCGLDPIRLMAAWAECQLIGFM